MGDNFSTELLGWKELVATHRKLQKSNIPQEWHLSESQLAELTRVDNDKSRGIDLITTKAAQQAKVLSPKEVEITEAYTATELLSQLAAGQLSSVEVTTAFCKRAAIAQQLVSPHQGPSTCHGTWKADMKLVDVMPHGNLLQQSYSDCAGA